MQRYWEIRWGDYFAVGRTELDAWLNFLGLRGKCKDLQAVVACKRTVLNTGGEIREVVEC